MPRDYDSDKPKRSWRDIDRNKDKSAHRKEDRPPMNPFKQARADSASKVYKSKLDSFFDIFIFVCLFIFTILGSMVLWGRFLILICILDKDEAKGYPYSKPWEEKKLQ